MTPTPPTDRDPRGRVPFAKPVRLKYPLFQDFISEFAENISLGGMFVKSAAPQPVGSEFDFEIALDDGPSLVRGRGVVVWVREASQEGGKPPGMGVCFLQLERESLDLVRRIVDEQVREGGARFDLLEAAVVGPQTPERFGKGPGDLGRRGSALAYWFSLAALSIAIGGLMVLAFDHYYVQPRLRTLESQAAQAALDGAGPAAESATAPTAAATPESSNAATDVRERSPDTSDPVEMVRAWAAAWSEQRVDDYLSHYATAFRPAGRRSREAWQGMRTERIARQSNVRVAIALPEVVESGPLERRVTFVQSYRSDTYRDRVRKLLRLVWEEDAWRIVEERVVRTLPT